MELRDYQKQISERARDILRSYGLCYISMECRTGKTLTALETARIYGAVSVLFVTKKKAIASVLSDYDKIRKDTPIYSIDVLNYESIHKASGIYDLVILDEAHSLGAYPKPSKRTKEVKTICKGKPCIFLSGTPSPESFSQLYHQFWVCDYSPFSEYTTFYKWAHEYVLIKQRKVNGYMINDYSRALMDKIDARIRHLFLSYTQEQAGFCANIIEHDIIIPMSQATNDYIHSIDRYSIAKTPLDDAIIADTQAKKLTKLHQLSSGTVISESGKRIIVDESKARYIKDNFKGRLAIFYVYEAEYDMLNKFFPNNTDSPEEFSTNADKTFICQVRRAREGVRLDVADSLIFFNIEYSYLSYEQGKNRLVSKERKSPANVYFLCSHCGIERYILQAVRGKRDFTLHYYDKNKTKG